jgi:hypothetical protein
MSQLDGCCLLVQLIFSFDGFEDPSFEAAAARGGEADGCWGPLVRCHKYRRIWRGAGWTICANFGGCADFVFCTSPYFFLGGVFPVSLGNRVPFCWLCVTEAGSYLAGEAEKHGLRYVPGGDNNGCALPHLQPELLGA